MSRDPLVERVAAACRDHRLLVPGDRVLVAVSAGADSSALALVLAGLAAYGLPLELRLGHVDHGWRGVDEARADREVVDALARRIGAPLAVAGPPPDARRTEDAARRFRYQALDRMAQAHGCAKVATGHHLRDQAETVLMRVLRGSGVAGLRGIPRRRTLGEAGVEVVRPLLDVDAREIRFFLRRVGASWREDLTNEDLSRDRARARARIVALEARGGSASRDLAALADRLRVRFDGYARRVDAHLEDVLVHHPHAAAVEVPRASLLALSPTHLDLALRRLGDMIRADRDGPWFTRRHVVLVSDALRRCGSVDLPRGVRFSVAPSRVWLRRRHVTLPEPLLVRGDADVSRFDLPGTYAALGRGGALVDAEILGPNARARRVRGGDRFRPLGREPDREVDVRAWLSKRRVPRWLRDAQVVVEGANGVAWVVGHRVDRRHAVTERTRRVARLSLRSAGTGSGPTLPASLRDAGRDRPDP